MREPSSTPGKQMGMEVDHASDQPEAPGELPQPLGATLGLGQQGERDERIGGEQVERHRPVTRVRDHLIQSSPSGLRPASAARSSSLVPPAA